MLSTALRRATIFGLLLLLVRPHEERIIQSGFIHVGPDSQLSRSSFRASINKLLETLFHIGFKIFFAESEIKLVTRRQGQPRAF
jgi:hypothetical protein